MNATIGIWLFFRCVRWAAWIFFLGFCAYFAMDRAPWLNSFGHLKHFTEALMFFPVLIAVFAGFFELMMRERAGIARPELGQLLPPHASNSKSPTASR